VGGVRGGVRVRARACVYARQTKNETIAKKRNIRIVLQPCWDIYGGKVIVYEINEILESCGFSHTKCRPIFMSVILVKLWNLKGGLFPFYLVERVNRFSRNLV
jgi:hypothetical protein